MCVEWEFITELRLLVKQGLEILPRKMSTCNLLNTRKVAQNNIFYKVERDNFHQYPCRKYLNAFKAAKQLEYPKVRL